MKWQHYKYRRGYHYYYYYAIWSRCSSLQTCSQQDVMSTQANPSWPWQSWPFKQKPRVRSLLRMWTVPRPRVLCREWGVHCMCELCLDWECCAESEEFIACVNCAERTQWVSVKAGVHLRPRSLHHCCGRGAKLAAGPVTRCWRQEHSRSQDQRNVCGQVAAMCWTVGALCPCSSSTGVRTTAGTVCYEWWTSGAVKNSHSQWVGVDYLQNLFRSGNYQNHSKS